MNASDVDVKKYIRIFTTLMKDEIEELEAQHNAAPEKRILQKALAKDITIRVHSAADYEAAVEASGILFGNDTAEALLRLDEKLLLNVMEGVPQMSLSKSALSNGIVLVDLLSVNTQVFSSKGEARKMIQGGGVSINKSKMDDPMMLVNTEQLLKGKYILVQKGKKNYFLLKAE